MFGSIIVFLLILSILVLVHELGHFLVAKRFGIWVEEFGLGLPPRIFGKKIGDTIYSINLLPFGGFVKLHGELTEDNVSKPEKAFLNKGKLIKTLVIVAGVIMNFLLAVVCFAIVYSSQGIPKETNNTKVLDIATGSPAQIAGLIQGDVIKSVGGVEIGNSASFIAEISKFKGKKVQVVLENGKKITLTPRENPPEGEGPLGVVVSSTEIYYPPVWQRPFYGVYFGFKEAIYWGKNIILGFVKIFTDLFSGNVPKDISGPVGIFAVTSEAAKFGINSIINLVGIISVNLAILNIFPFPALDGGRLLFIVIEAIFGKKILPKVEATIHTIGMIILLVLILAITIHDVRNLIAAGSIANFLHSMGQ
jgi:regulator of sigma E protease